MMDRIANAIMLLAFAVMFHGCMSQVNVKITETKAPASDGEG